MAISREKKVKILQDLTEQFKKAKSVVLADYRGLDVKNLRSLRKKLREKSVELKIAKKTLLKKAVQDAGRPEIPEELLKGPICAAFSYQDEIIPAKEIFLFSRQTGFLKLTGGLIGEDILNQEQIKALALIPSREELLAQLAADLKAPLFGLYHALSFNLRGLLNVLKAIRA